MSKIKTPTVAQLRHQNEVLRRFVQDTWWMARRYADRRQSVAAGMFNDRMRELLELGVINLTPGLVDKTIWAQDGGGRKFDDLTEMQCTPDSASAVGDWIVEPRMKVHEKIAEILGTNEPDKALVVLLELMERAGESCE